MKEDNQFSVQFPVGFFGKGFSWFFGCVCMISWGSKSRVCCQKAFLEEILLFRLPGLNVTDATQILDAVWLDILHIRMIHFKQVIAFLVWNCCPLIKFCYCICNNSTPLPSPKIWTVTIQLPFLKALHFLILPRVLTLTLSKPHCLIAYCCSSDLKWNGFFKNSRYILQYRFCLFKIFV